MIYKGLASSWGGVNVQDISHGNSIEKVYKNEDLKFNKIYPYYFIAINNGTSFTWRLNSKSQKITTVANEEIKVPIKQELTSCSSMFLNCNVLTSLDLSYLDTNNVNSMNQMFTRCINLTSLILGNNFDTSNVTNMSQMFYQCPRLTSLDVSSFDTSNVTSMSSMFYGCVILTSLDLSNFNTSNVTNMNQMFYNCKNLTSLDLSNFDTSNVTNMSQMFANCSKLTHIKCKQKFKDWCIANANYISLPTAMQEGDSGTWKIVS